MAITDTVPTPPQTPPATPPHGIGRALVRRFVDEIVNRGRFDVLSEIVHPEYRYVGPDGTRLDGPDELEQMVRGFRSGFSDLHATVLTDVAEGASVAMTMMLTGTHDGEFDGIPASGALMSLPVAVFARIEDGLIIEDREFYDTATMLMQLGIDTVGGDTADS